MYRVIMNSISFTLGGGQKSWKSLVQQLLRLCVQLPVGVGMGITVVGLASKQGGFPCRLSSPQTQVHMSPPLETRLKKRVCVNMNRKQLEDAHACRSTNICVSTNSLVLGVGWMWGEQEKGGNRNGNQNPCTQEGPGGVQGRHLA